MSYGARPRVIPATPSRKPVTATGAEIGAIAGAAAVAGSLAVVNGVLAVADGLQCVREIAQDAIKDTTAAQGSAANFLAYPMDLDAEALPLFRAGLEARQVRFAEGGTLHLVDGQRWNTAYTALDQNNRVLFFVHTTNDGRVELLVQGQAAMAAVEGVVVETLMTLAVETLSQQGFQIQSRGNNRWTMERRAEDGITEQVVFDYQNGRLAAEAISRDQHGKTLAGNDCPNLNAFTDFFRDPDFYSLAGEAPPRPDPSKSATERETRRLPATDSKTRRIRVRQRDRGRRSTQ